MFICFSISLVLKAQDQSLSKEALEKNISKIDVNIKNTKEQMKSIGDASYLADLYFVLAEFLVEKAKLKYQLKIAQNPDVPVNDLDFTIEKRPKEEAIGVYETFLEKFPTDSRRDRALFFKAHELRELGRKEDMLKTYRKLSSEFPKSQYWPEVQLNLGDVYFEEKKNFDLALEYYKSLEKVSDSEFLPLAYYRMGWCYINKTEFLNAYKAYEKSIFIANELKAKNIEIKNEIREQALLAMVWPYSEIPIKKIEKVHPATTSTLEHFRQISFGFDSYQKLLKKLANRMVLKKRYNDAVDIYIETLAVYTDLEERLSAMSKLYQLLRNSIKDVKRPGLAQYFDAVLSELMSSDGISAKDKKKYYWGMEQIVRDYSYENHKAQKKSQQFKENAIKGYQVYVRYFKRAKYSDYIRYNYAGLLFSRGNPFEAAKEYEFLARKKSRKLKKSWKSLLKSSLEAYLSALGKGSLQLLEKTQARDALRNMGELFLKRYPKDSASSSILFNIGQSYYNERNFNDAVKYFKRFIQSYPSDTKLSLAVNQILDAHNQREDYKAIIKDGEWFLKSNRVGNPTLRDNVKEIVSQAKLISVRKQSSNLSQEGYAKNMLKLASKFKGTDLGDKALYEAFILYRSQRSSEMYTPGSILLKNHSNSKYAKQVAGDMVQTALLTADFERASKYLEYYGTQYPKDKESELFLNQAAEIRSIIRDYSGAKRVYNKIGNLKQIAEMDLLAKDWKALLSSAQRVSEPLRSYYLAMAYRELKQSIKAEKILRSRMTRIKGSGNKEVLVKAIYLQALLGLDRYQKIRFSKSSDDQAVVGKKTAGLQVLTESFSSVIATGDAEMTLAALSGLGEVYKAFGDFLKEAKVPKGLNKDQKKFYKSEIQKQVNRYIEQSNNYFDKCLDAAKQANMYSKFLVYCKERSQAVDLPGLVPRFKENDNANIENLRKALFDRPRDPQIYRDIVEAQILDKNFGAALATANRATEMFPENVKVASSYIYVLLHIGDFKEAGAELNRAIKIDAYNSELKSIKHQLRQYFGFVTKKQNIPSSIRSFLPGWL